MLGREALITPGGTRSRAADRQGEPVSTSGLAWWELPAPGPGVRDKGLFTP